MATAFDRSGLVAEFDAIGAEAAANGTRLEFAVYGGAALMLAGNFRFATEDVASRNSPSRGRHGLPRSWRRSLHGTAGSPIG